MKPFAIEVEYANPEEILEQLRELLFRYRQIYRPGLQEELSESDADYRDIEKKSELAFSTLQTIFPDCPEIEEGHLRGSWGGASDRTTQEIESDLQSLARDLQWPTGANNGLWHSTADNAEECYKKVEQFMEKKRWPLTNVVRHAAHFPYSWRTQRRMLMQRRLVGYTSVLKS